MQFVISHLKKVEEIKLDFILLILLGLVLFFPIFLGKFSIAGTDLLFNHYPNLIWGQQIFKQYGSFPLWNGDIFLGSDFTKSMHAHYLNPLLWFVFLFKNSNILYALTWFYLVLNILMGFFSYRIAKFYNLDRYLALIVAVTSQASMFFWFAMTTMIGVYMSCFALISIYTILTFSQRTKYLNYIILTITLFFVVSTPHPAYILGVILPIVGLVMYLQFPLGLLKPWRGLTGVFALSMITAILLSSYRLLPVFKAILCQGVAMSQLNWMATPPVNNFYLLMTMINPLSWGANIGQSLFISDMLGYDGTHIQACTALYFGIFSLFMLFFLFKKKNQKHASIFLVLFLMILAGFINFSGVCTDFVVLIMYPVLHGQLFRINSFFIFLTLMIVGLKQFQQHDQRQIRQLLKGFLVFSMILFLMGIVFYAKICGAYLQRELVVNKNIYPHLFRLTVFSLLFLIFLVSRISTQYFSSNAFRKFIILFSILGAIVLVFFTKKFNFMLSSNIIFLKNYFALLIGILGILNYLNTKKEIHLWCGISLALLITCLKVKINTPEVNNQIFLVSITGWLSYILMVFTLVSVLGCWTYNKLNKQQMHLALLVLVSVDLVVSYVNYSYCNLNGYSPYYHGIENAYPRIHPVQSEEEIKSTYEQNVLNEQYQQNLFKNNEFNTSSDSQFENWSLGGKGITFCDKKHPEKEIVKVCYDSNDEGGNLFQDVSLENNVKKISAGVWVKSPYGTDLGLFITNPSNNLGTTRIVQKGDGRWHWICQSIQAENNLKLVRVHFNIIGKGGIKLFGPRLVKGEIVVPKKTPSEDYEPYVLPKPEFFDAHNFRFSHVTIFNKNQGNELVSNYSMLYHTPTYAGVDSDQSSDFVEFLDHFKKLDSSWWARFGLLGVIEDSRFLDLVGVKYDVDKNGNKIERPGALPRFAAFSSYKTETNREKGFKILKDPTFIYDKELLVNQKIDFPYEQQSAKYQQLNYINITNDEFSLKINSATPRLVLFNDHFSPDWEASFNGKKLSIFVTNNLFMGVVLPPGSGNLIFSFKPKLFWICVKISLFTFALFVISIFVYLLMLLQKNLKMKPKILVDTSA